MSCSCKHNQSAEHRWSFCHNFCLFTCVNNDVACPCSTMYSSLSTLWGTVPVFSWAFLNSFTVHMQDIFGTCLAFDMSKPLELSVTSLQSILQLLIAPHNLSLVVYGTYLYPLSVQLRTTWKCVDCRGLLIFKSQTICLTTAAHTAWIIFHRRWL